MVVRAARWERRRMWLHDELRRDEPRAPAPSVTLPRAASLSPATVLALQRTAGNQAVARTLARSQAEPDDAAADASFVDTCTQYFADNPMSFVRLMLEFTRPW